MKIYDSHTHLNQEMLYPEWEELFSSFIGKGGSGLVNAGANEYYNKRGLEIAKICKEKYPKCFVKCALGWHPCDVERMSDNLEEEKNALKNLILSNKEYVVAVGECGIDLHYGTPETLLKQQQYFKAQCELARETHQPIMIHTRDGFHETFEVLQEFKDLVVYIHCWGYGKDEIDIMLKNFPNLFIGFCGNVSYKNAENIRESVKALPIEKILIETDAPYLSPQGHRGETNCPERVADIGQFLAELLGIKEEVLWNQIEKNFFSLYH